MQGQRRGHGNFEMFQKCQVIAVTVVVGRDSEVPRQWFLTLGSFSLTHTPVWRREVL